MFWWAGFRWDHKTVRLLLQVYNSLIRFNNFLLFYPGTWTEWGEWSECSVELCGGGQSSRARECEGGQMTCQGMAEEIQDCNTETCGNFWRLIEGSEFKVQFGARSNTPKRRRDEDFCKSPTTQDNITSYYYTLAFQSVWAARLVTLVTKQEIAPF